MKFINRISDHLVDIVIKKTLTFNGHSQVFISKLEKLMEPYTYELFIERGWRRCGTYYYKPNIEKSCCQLWTHRMYADKFKPKKDQKKAIKKVIALAFEKV